MCRVLVAVVVLVGCGGGVPVGESDAAVGALDASVELDTRADGGAPDAGADVDAGDPCGEHGSFHVNHCDCEPGYREVRGRCEPIPSCTADAHEPNDSLALATSLDGGRASGQLCANDVDAFLFTAPSGVQLEVQLQFLQADGNLDLALYEPNRDPRFASPVARADSNTDDELISHRTRRSGAFLVLVSGRGSGTQAPYVLNITTR